MRLLFVLREHQQQVINPLKNGDDTECQTAPGITNMCTSI